MVRTFPRNRSAAAGRSDFKALPCWTAAISMAAPLSEKQRSAAFAAPHPLAWVDICAPLFASVPDRKSFYDKYVFEADVYRRTRRSFPRVRPTCCAFFVHRGSMDDETSWHRGRADFVQHSTGRWLCLRRLFQFSSKRCPSGFILLDMEEIVYFLLAPSLKSYTASWCEVRKTK